MSFFLDQEKAMEFLIEEKQTEAKEEGIDINFQMSCFYASIVYIAMIPLTIVYMIFAHGVKKEFKIYKKSKKFAKKIAKGKMEFSSVKEKFQEQTRKILEEKYDMAV